MGEHTRCAMPGGDVTGGRAMYIPKFNAVSDPAILFALMRQFSFATLVTTISSVGMRRW